MFLYYILYSQKILDILKEYFIIFKISITCNVKKSIFHIEMRI